MTEAAPSKKILLVEDSKNISTVLVDVLKAEGYAVIHAPDGVTGVAMTRREKPDLVLLDLLLPKLSGYDVCNAIKRDNNTRHIPVLVISTMDKPESVARAKACGAANFMRKPYNLDDLLAEIKRLLGQ
ncbi:MAG: response regulator receiver [Elusimicrobia bacterium]|nr:MAG: response regulator receiver [Elusimicrobiota bacterium]KAF0156584.1 MAG: response regulator receiver [Elusimicrobiota bacterium]